VYLEVLAELKAAGTPGRTLREKGMEGVFGLLQAPFFGHPVLHLTLRPSSTFRRKTKHMQTRSCRRRAYVFCTDEHAPLRGVVHEGEYCRIIVVRVQEAHVVPVLCGTLNPNTRVRRDLSYTLTTRRDEREERERERERGMN
jgi:hypothetical protein